MFCKNCGKEIDNTAKFCPECGAKQDTNKTIQEEYFNPDSKTSEKADSIFSAFKIPLIIFAVTLFILICIGISYSDCGKNSNGSTSNRYSSQQNNTRTARIDDIILTYSVVENLFENDYYYIYIQAQEKITNLKIKLYYKNAKGEIIKTEILNIGKVVPGNKYTYKLYQSDIDWDDIDKTTKFSYSIETGTVTE